MKGIGIKATAINPRRLLAQGMPKLWNIGLTNSGNAAANIDRRKVLAAIALAPYFWNVSMR